MKDVKKIIKILHNDGELFVNTFPNCDNVVILQKDNPEEFQVFMCFGCFSKLK